MESILFIVNPVSGGKDKTPLVDLIQRRADRKRFSIEVVYTAYAGHATVLARESRAEIIVAVGGDGTVSEVAAGLVGSDKAMGIIPCGSGDGLALHLGISRRPSRAIAQLNRSESIVIDSCTVNGEPFFCTSGVGFDAAVALEFSRAGKRGLLTYISKAWSTWFNFTPATYRIEVQEPAPVASARYNPAGENWEGQAVFVTVGNANQWGNMARITSLASVNDGLLDICIVKPFRLPQIIPLAWQLMTGRAHASRKTLMMRGKAVRLVRSEAGPMHRDGDPGEAGNELIFKILPASLKVMVPA